MADMSSIPSMVTVAPPAADNMSVLLWAVSILAFAAGVFIRWAAKKHERLELRQEATETLIQGKLFDTIGANTDAMRKSAEANERLAESITDLRMDLSTARADDETRRLVRR